MEKEQTRGSGSTNFVRSTNEHFKNVFDLIPRHAYFDSEFNQKLLDHQSKQHVVKGRDVGKSQKDYSEKMSNKQLLKKVKLDPTQVAKTSELQQASLQVNNSVDCDSHTPQISIAVNGVAKVNDVHSQSQRRTQSLAITNGESVQANGGQEKDELVLKINGCSKPKDLELKKSSSDGKRLKKRKHSKGLELEPSSTSSSMEHDPEDLNLETEAVGQKLPEITGHVESQNDEVDKTVKLSPDELREKIQMRIQDLKAKRMHGMTPEEYLESKRLRRKASKLKSKQKRKESKKLKLSVQKQAKNNQSKVNGVAEVKPETNSLNFGSTNMVFSKFEFSEQAKKPKDKQPKKPKSYKELYDKVIKDKAKFVELQQTDADKAKQVAEKNAWRKAMDQSKGIKVKDDPVLLKKSMKKEEKLKQHSQKKWQERVAHVAEQQQKRQDKRKKNIQAKKQTKVDRKIKLAKKKGRIISGF